MFIDWIKDNEMQRLGVKLGGVGGSFVASHMVALTTTPAYAHFWNKIFMTAPTITDIPAFEKMVTFYFALGWICLEHAWQRFSIKQKPAVNPPQEEKK